jgi:hypothetical protein
MRRTQTLGGQIPPNVIRPCKYSIKPVLIFKHEWDIYYNHKNGFQRFFMFTGRFKLGVGGGSDPQTSVAKKDMEK